MRRSALLSWALPCLFATPLLAGSDFRFVILGDRVGGAEPGVYEDIVREVSLLHPDMVITVGDEVEGPANDARLNREWDEYLEIVRTLTVPVYLIPGNNDITDAASEKTWRSRTGRPPFYSFDFRGAHFVVLDNSRWERFEDLPPEEAGFLRKDLAARKESDLVLVFMHKPFFAHTLGDGKPDALHDLFRKHGVDAVFAGHFHSYASTVYDGIPYTILGSSGGEIGEPSEPEGAFYQYALATVKDNRLSWAVLKKGSVLAPDFRSVEESNLVFRIESEYVTLGPATIPAGPLPVVLEVPIKVLNPAPRPIKAGIRWKAPAGWVVEPVEQELEAPADGALEARAGAIVNGSVYPAPVFTIRYPYGEGKVHEMKGALPIMRAARCGRLEQPPVIDGTVSEEEYKGASIIDSFGAPDGSACVLEPTTFRLGWDAENVYIAAVCAQKDPASLQATSVNRDDPIYAEDCVGFFFAPDPAQRVIYQVYFNPLGTCLDMKLTLAPGRIDQDPAWNGSFEVKAGRGEGQWSVEARIPVADLGVAALGAGDQWRFNCRRKEPSLRSSADFQVPILAEPKGMAVLSFE